MPELLMTFVSPVFVLSCSVISLTFHGVFVFVCMFPYMVVLLDSYGDRGCCTLVQDSQTLRHFMKDDKLFTKVLSREERATGRKDLLIQSR